MYTVDTFINTSYSFSPRCDARMGLSMGLALLAALVTSVIIGVLAYRGQLSLTIAYSTAPAIGVGFILTGAAFACIRKESSIDNSLIDRKSTGSIEVVKTTATLSKKNSNSLDTKKIDEEKLQTVGQYEKVSVGTTKFVHQKDQPPKDQISNILSITPLQNGTSNSENKDGLGTIEDRGDAYGVNEDF